MFFPNSKDGISVNDMLGKFSGFYNNWMSKGSDSYRDMRRSKLEILPLAQYDLDITNENSPANRDANQWFLSNKNKRFFPCDNKVLPDPTKKKMTINTPVKKKFDIK